MAHHPGAYPSPFREERVLEIGSLHLPQIGSGEEHGLPRESVCSKKEQVQWPNSETQCFPDRSLQESLGETRRGGVMEKWRGVW